MPEKSCVISIAHLLYANKVRPDLTPRLNAAAEGYALVIERDGQRIIKALERYTGFQYLEENTLAFILSGTMSASGSAATGNPIKLGADVDSTNFERILSHELGHRILSQRNITTSLSPHQMLDLFLFDVWESVYGEEKAKKFLELEMRDSKSPRGEKLSYKAAWEWAMALTLDERKNILTELRENASPTELRRFTSFPFSWDW